MIECRNLTKSYGVLEAVSDFSLHLEEHEFLSILGPSGCGKSTLLRLIAGLEVPSKGQVLLEKLEISGKKIILPPESRKFGMIFQDFALFPHLSVEKNIAYGVSGSRSEKQKRVDELLKLVSLQHLTCNNLILACAYSSLKKLSSPAEGCPLCWLCSASIAHLRTQKTSSSRLIT